MAATFEWLNSTALYSTLLIPDTATVMYANPAATTTFVTSILLHNTHSSALTVTLYRVPDVATAVGTAAAGNQFFVRSMPAYETFVINDMTMILGDTNDTIQATCGTASKVTMFIDGVQKT